ncbi:hypothetical protein, partial [Pontibacter ruber]
MRRKSRFALHHLRTNTTSPQASISRLRRGQYKQGWQENGKSRLLFVSYLGAVLRKTFLAALKTTNAPCFGQGAFVVEGVGGYL